MNRMVATRIQQAKDKAHAVDRWLQRQLQRSFERRLGVDTLGLDDPEGLGPEGAGRVWHVPSPNLPLRRVLKRLQPGPADVLADIGSGKGQAVLVAAQLPFGRVIGVELADELTQVARGNVERARPRLRCKDIELVTADALEWAIPDDLSVVYLYCPFIGDFFERMMERIFASYDAHPRRLHIVYGYPWEHNGLLGTGRVAVVDINSSHWPARPGWWETDYVIVTYEVTPANGATFPAPLRRRGLGWRKGMEYWSRPNDTRFVLYPPEGPPLLSHPPDEAADAR